MNDLVDETANGGYYVPVEQDDWMQAKARRTMKRTGWQLQSFWEAYADADYAKAAWILDQLQRK